MIRVEQSVHAVSYPQNPVSDFKDLVGGSIRHDLCDLVVAYPVVPETQICGEGGRRVMCDMRGGVVRRGV